MRTLGIPAESARAGDPPGHPCRRGGEPSGRRPAPFIRFDGSAATQGFARRRRYFHGIGGISLFLLLAVMSAFAGPASASQTRNFTGTSFGPDGPAGTRSFESLRGLAVDQSKGFVYAYDAAEGGTVYKFDTDGNPLPFSTVAKNSIGNVGSGNPGEGQIAVAPPGSPGNTAGDIYVADNSTVKVFSEAGVELGTLGTGETCGVAVSPSGTLFIGSYSDTIREYVPTGNPPTDQDLVATGSAAIGLCNVAADGVGQIFAANFEGHQFARLAGITDSAPTVVSPGGRTLFADPATNELDVDRGDRVVTYDRGGVVTGQFGKGNLMESVGVAVYGASDRAYASDATSGRVQIYGKAYVPPAAVGVSFVNTTEAVALGSVDPEGVEVTECFIEYGLSGKGLERKAPCETLPPSDSEPHLVRARLTGLELGSTYRYRVVAVTEDETLRSAIATFKEGDPLISEVRAFDADRHSASLEATIDPGGFKTTYQIEWSVDGSFANVAGVGTIAEESGPTRVSTRLTGLQEGTTYLYRVVASNELGGPAVSSLERKVETLNGCGLLEGRCFELSSERESGPVASSGHGINGYIARELKVQAAERSGALAYISEGGYPGATRGGELLYEALRGPAAWSNIQLSPAVVARNEQGGVELNGGNEESSNSSRTLALSPELSCGVVEASQPIPGTTPRMNEILERGGYNLYRMDRPGLYTPITTRAPVEPLPGQADLGALGGNAFAFAGMSRDCSHIYFSSVYHYPGSEAIEENPLYEWSEGRLRDVGRVPDGGGESSTASALPGNDRSYSERADRNAVSTDGDRIFFTASRKVGRNPDEVGTPGLFVREDGTSTRDVSLSETAVADTNPRYQWATPDGSEVFFTAPAGLTPESSAEGTDLYVYDLSRSASEGRLKDLSVDPVGDEAGVVGMVGASTDGSRIYFAATGRLVPGEGLTVTENNEAETYSLYLLEGGRIRFVSTVSRFVTGGQAQLLLSNASQITSQVSPDGRYLVYESHPSASDGQPAPLPEVYIFDADATKEAVSCVSCQPGGLPSVRGQGYYLLPGPGQASVEPGAVPAPRSLTVGTDGPVVVFSSTDVLAPGAVEGASNIFEWAHGQVSLLASEPLILLSKFEPESVVNRNVISLGSNSDGTDIYLATPISLTWEDDGGGSSVYDARIGGGFVQPPQGTACDPTQEGACQGPSVSSPPSPSPQTPGFVGPRNQKPPRCKKSGAKRHVRCRRGHRHRHSAGKSGSHGKAHRKSAKEKPAGNGRRASK